METPSVFDAAKDGRRDDVLAALSADAGVALLHGAHGVTLLHIAAERDDAELAEALLAAGAELDAEAGWGQTPFEWAANMGSARVATFLLERGASRLDLWTAAALGRMNDVTSCFGPEGVVAGSGREPRPGADLSGWPADAPFRTGDAVSDAFYIACRNGHVNVARYLLEHGADPDAVGYFGATALHWAALHGHAQVVTMLLEAGADPARKDPRFDADAAGWAREGGHDGLARSLAGQGADG